MKDLLTEDEGRANSNNFPLRVREHPRLGPYVQGKKNNLTQRIKLSMKVFHEVPRICFICNLYHLKHLKEKLLSFLEFIFNSLIFV